MSSVFTISDLLSEEDWNQEYHSEEKLESLKKIFEVAIEILGKRDIIEAHDDENREEVHPGYDLRNPFGEGGKS